jgi:glycosyltransferase involved in cell wall biosynthesis
MEREIDRADLIRVESALVHRQLLEAGVSDERLVQARPGVDLARFRPGPGSAAPVVAYVGALSLWKGLDVLVDVSRSLAASDASLEIIGGPVCHWSRRTAESLIRARTTSVPDLLARADALVLPSIVDGFGYVVLEAMASGAVPFVTPAVGAAELVRALDPRLVIERGDFAEAVPELLATLPMANLALQARLIAEQHERMVMARQAANALLVAAHRLGLIEAA